MPDPSPDPNLPWDALAAIGAFLTAFVAWWQIGSLKKQQRGWKTLEACERYESDPVLNDVLCKLRVARDAGLLKKDPRPFRLEAVIVLNCLEGVAIGVEQGFYDERIVKDHLEPIRRFHAGEFLTDDMKQRMALIVGIGSFDRIKVMISKWGQKTKFRF